MKLRIISPPRLTEICWIFRVGFMVAALCFGATAARADWPMYRHDLHRSGITDETLALPLSLAWRHDAAQPPKPAWPEPIRIVNRMDFDYAPHPVIAGGTVFLASSADDTLRAFDASTGKLKWRFVAGGPIRFAPQVEDGRVFFAADDGVAYCLDAGSGKAKWTFNAAPVDERMIGNGRMISRWPIRTGVLVSNGAVYLIAGIWPTEGLYAFSLDAKTGAVNWCNDTCGGIQTNGVGGSKWNPNDPHASEFGGAGLTPQGAMLADNHVLIVPLANNAPATFNRLTGGLLNFVANSSGGANVQMDGDMYFRPIQGKGPLTIFGTRAPSRGQPNRALTFPSTEIPQLDTYPNAAPDSIRLKGKVSFLVKDEKLTAKIAYGLCLANDKLIVGGNGLVTIHDKATDKELWRAVVDGEARELAVSDGRLFVATHRGTLYCFAPGEHSPILAVPATNAVAPPNDSARAVLSELENAGISRGFALVIGDAEGALATTLAANTELHIVMPVADAVAAQALRNRLVDATSLYGSRIHVQVISSFDRLPFSQYFANAVIVVSPTGKLNSRELYRVTRPCGGLILMPGVPPERADALLREATPIPREVIVTTRGRAPAILRGPLAGARDWNTGAEPDHLVKWPLRPIWFGGPSSTLGMFSVLGQHPPVAAAGRYFILGDATLSAVDAYNGVVLWTRAIPTLYPNLRKIDGVLHAIADSPKNEYPQQMSILRRVVGADDKFVYLTLGKSYFRGDGEACIKLDVKTGEQIEMYAPFSSGKTIALDRARTWPIEIDTLREGSVKMEPGADGLKVTLALKSPEITPLDTWDLFFDFRAPDSRYGLFDRGAFQIIVSPAKDSQSAPQWTRGAGPAFPAIGITGTREGAVSTAVLTIPWKQIESLCGSRPKTFAFSATLTTHNGERESAIVQRRLFCDANAAGLNNGWGTMLLGNESEIKAQTKPSVVLGAFEAMPTDWAKKGAVNPEGIDATIKASPRVHPLTGELVPRIYRSGAAGCGRITFSDTSAFGRAAKLSISIYDFEDDSGLRNFAGIASNCGPGMKSMSIQAALGLLIASEARSHCDCMVPIRTSVAFAPAERRLNEDWATFFDRDVDTRVRHAAINFGAPGDRRDAGTLWLGFPRAGGRGIFPLEAASRHVVFTAPPISSCLQLPLKIEKFQISGRINLNSDRVTIAGTDRPWLYASAMRGIKKATLRVNFLTPITSRENGPPGNAQLTLPFTRTDIFIHHDAEKLYVTASRPAVTDRMGKFQPWTQSTKGDDADVWDDDSFEMFITDASNKRVIHLGTSASGARFDAISNDAKEDRGWNGVWKSTSAADESAMKVELSIPLKTLADAGLDAKTLCVNFQMNQKNLKTFMTSYPGADSNENPTTEAISEPMASLGNYGRTRCENFAPLGLGMTPEMPERAFTLRLHFAEIDNAQEGARVFDVKVQDRVLLEKFDIVKAAGGTNKAVVKEFTHIMARDSIVLEFVPQATRSKEPAAGAAPIINALEVIDEEFNSMHKKAAP